MTDSSSSLEGVKSASGSEVTSDHKGLLAFFTTNKVSANLIMLFMLVGGFFGASQIKTEIFPAVNPGIIQISVSYPGATPSEVEESITKRIDDVVFGIDGVDKVTSTASENSARVSVEYKDFADEFKVRDDIESAIDQIVDFPPEDAEEPDINISESVAEVIRLVVMSDGDERDLREGAAVLEEELRSLPSVTQVVVDGARDYEIAIEVSENALRMYGLTIQQVANAVRRSSINLSSGELKTDSGDVLLRTNNKGLREKDFEDIVIRAQPDGSALLVRDVATVRDGFIDVDLSQQFNGKNAIFVRVLKSEVEDILTIAEEVRTALPSFDLPEGITVDVWTDQTEVLEDRLGLLLRNGALGFTLVALFLVIMLDLRLAFWVAMGVPIAFAGGLLLFNFSGLSINMVTLFALIVVLGIVVDDAIVVGENIGKERERGLKPVDAALAGVRGVIAPVSIGVLTTMMAFAPLLFVSGTFGQILGDVSIVVIIVLVMSLIEVFFILPCHLSHAGNWSRWPLDVVQTRTRNLIHDFRDKILVPAVRVAIRHKYLTVLCSIGFLAIAVALFLTGLVRFIFFPQLEAVGISSQVVFPVGTPYQVTEEAAKRITEAAYRLNEKTDRTAFKSINQTIGGRQSTVQGPGGSGSFQFASNVANIDIALNPEPLRTLSASELERMWRQETGPISGVDQISFSSEFFGGFNRINYELSHRDEDTLDAAAAFLEEEFEKINGLVEVVNSQSQGKRQFDIVLTDAGSAAGLTQGDIARQLRRSFFGEEVHRIQRGRDELKVMVRFPKSERTEIRDIYNTRIRLEDGTQVPLAHVASLSENRSYSSIQRIDGLRTLNVSAEIDFAVYTPDEALALVESTAIPALRERFTGIRVQATGATQEQQEDFAALGTLALIAMGLIYVCLATLLRSYVQPLIVMVGVPLGVAGAVIGHFLLGTTISFISIFGMVALSGVVINDSLILIDLYNKLRRAGMEVFEAIVEAVRGRFRAIFLTTVTTSLGLTPMLFEPSTQAQFLIPMAVSLATGILFASVMILFVVPSVLKIREDLRLREPDLQQDITHRTKSLDELVST